MRRKQRSFSDDPVGQRILDALNDRPQTWLAREAGVSTSTISDAIEGGIAKTETAIKLAGALGVDVGWLLTGQFPPANDSSISAMLTLEHAAFLKSGLPKSAVDQLRRVGTFPNPAHVGDESEAIDLVAIGEIDLAYGLGGTFADGPVETQMLHFSRSFLESITSTPPSMLTFARGRGDSMQPTLQDDDIVLIDRSHVTVREQDALWALTIGDIAMIKRLRIRGEAVQILSDNDRVPADEAHHEEVNIVGRVIFIGRKL